MKPLLCIACVAHCLVVAALSAAEAASVPGPRVFWASDPLRPNETVLLQGSDLGADALVEMARLDDAEPSDVAVTSPTGASTDTPAAQRRQWTRVPLVQGNDQSLKFVVPASWTPGVFACRITAHGATTEPTLLNEPDPWWMQGDEGEAATPGGWLRVLGKSLAGAQPTDKPRCLGRLESDDGTPDRADAGRPPTVIRCVSICLRDLPPGKYTVWVHNGSGGASAWSAAGPLRIVPAPKLPGEVFDVLEAYGADAAKQMRNSLVKYNLPLDRTEGILAALEEGQGQRRRHRLFSRRPLHDQRPASHSRPHAAQGRRDGPGDAVVGRGAISISTAAGRRGASKVDGPKPPDMLIFGQDYGIEDLSIYLPLEYEQGIVADKRLRMQPRARAHRSLLAARAQRRGHGRPHGPQFSGHRLRHSTPRAQALVSGKYGLIANNRILAGKTNTPLGGAWGVIVENNQFVGMDPTAYQNIAGCGRNIYYAHNRQESLFAHQADYSFTFDAGAGAYLGGIAETQRDEGHACRPTRPIPIGRRRKAACGGARPFASWPAAARANGATWWPTRAGSGKSTGRSTPRPTPLRWLRSFPSTAGC